MLTRLVNGQRVEVPALEEAEILAQWAEPPAPPPVPRVVTKLQLFDALDAMDMDLDTLLAAMPAKGKRRFELAVEIKRTDPLINSVALSIGWTTEQVDALFMAAAAL